MNPIQPGRIIADRFQIERVADSGGMGVVYRAQDLQTECAVALKVIADGTGAPADRFAHEVEVLSGLDHPHIVGYVTHGVVEEGLPFLVMPWLEGSDLEHRLRLGPLAIDETLTLARSVAGALAYLHERGIVHRDLKPSNLFLPGGDFEDVRVIDLGVARPSIAARALTLSGTLIGTPGFIAPEQARGDREIAPTVDIFSLGCVLFECLTGRRLFSGPHLMSVLAKILLEDAPRVRELRPEVPTALDALVNRMVSKDPARRPKDGAELARWLTEFERGGPPDSRPPSSQALGAGERRVVSVLVTLLPPSRATAPLRPDETRVEADPFRVSAARFGVRAQLLGERMALVLAPEGVSAADQATVLARFAGNVVETFPGASVALATGSAFTGSLLPTGEAIDRAVTTARTATAAQGVVVDESTAALIESRFELRGEAGHLFVEGERVSADTTRPLLGRPTPCVGRERELAILETTTLEAEAEGLRVVLATAVAGAGKSRLRHELLRRLRGRGEALRILFCRGDPLRLAAPYSLVSQAVREAADVQEFESPEQSRNKLRAHVGAKVTPADAARVSDFLSELVGVATEPQGGVPLRAARLDALAMADQVGRAFEDILRAWCEERPVVLVLEDFHWADSASVKLLERALRKLAGARLFVLALARPEVHDRFPGVFSHRDLTEIRLPPLPRRACAKLVVEVMGEGVPAAEVARIVERSEGNAFYLEELIRASSESSDDQGVPSSGAGEDRLPTTVLAVAQARLERLEPTARRALRAASVFGEVFWVEGMSALLGEPPAMLERVIGTLLENEAIVPSEHRRIAGMRELAFRHVLLREMAYTTLTEDDRRLGHRLAAAWLEEVGEDGEVVALHWLRAGERTRAADCFTRAGEMRSGRAQADAAARCFLRALLVADPEREAPEVLEARTRWLAAALEATRSLDAKEIVTGLDLELPSGATPALRSARTLLVQALERTLAPLRGPSEHPRLPIVLAYAACAASAIAAFDVAAKYLTEATDRTADDGPMHRAVRYASAKVSYLSQDSVTAVDLLTDTILPEDPSLRAEILLILAWAVIMVDGKKALARGLDFVSRAESIRASRPPEGGGPALDDPVAQVRCIKARFFCFYFTGEYPRACEAAEEALTIARRAGLRFDECAQMHNLGETYLRLGQLERARESIAGSNEIARDIGADWARRLNDVLLAYLDRRAGDLSAAAAAAHEFHGAWHELYARLWLGQLLASTRSPDARAALEQALALARQLKLRPMAEDCLRALASLDSPPAADASPAGPGDRTGVSSKAG